MRLFIALTLSDPMKRALTDTMHEMKKQGVKGSFVPRDNLHLTLAYIGEWDSPGQVKEALSQITVKPFRLSFSELGLFGDVLWVGVKGNQGLSQLARSIRQALEAAGVPFDPAPFKPHVTILRKCAGGIRGIPAPKGEMMVTDFALFKSAQKDGKRVYTKLPL